MVIVLLTVVTATIAMMLANLAVTSLRAESARSSVAAAVDLLDAARAEFERDLSTDPWVFQKKVHRLERTRLCASEDPATLVAASAPWPADCGQTWSYEPGALSTAAIEIEPPSPSSNLLTVRFLAPSSAGDVGVEASYVLGGRTQPTTFSGSDLALADLRGGAGTVTLSGITYSAGSINLTGGATYDAATLVAEDGFTAVGAGAGARLLSGESDPTAPVGASRPLVPRFNASSLLGAFDALQLRACPDAPSVNVNGRLSHACFVAGESFVTAAGAQVIVPEDVTRYLLWPARGSAQTFDVFVSTSSAALPGASCASPCDFAAVSAAALANDTHPAELAAWTQLGRFNLPSGAVVAFDRDVHVGACGNAFTSPSANCDDVSVVADMTVLVGSASDPADLWLAAPVSSPSSAFGAAVSGSIRIPFWSHSPGSAVRFDVSLVVLAERSGSSVSVFPSASAQTGQQAAGITIAGTLAAPSLSFSPGHADAFSYAAPASHLATRSPYLPTVSRLWHLDSLRRIDVETAE